mmetsp:Transcript_14143/g.31578  ORF Transcript_14143/g.31578 Transcript_14143/m.31578 type:complete len:775 (-) Transcript_14143:52-2376(-)
MKLRRRAGQKRPRCRSSVGLLEEAQEAAADVSTGLSRQREGDVPLRELFPHRHPARHYGPSVNEPTLRSACGFSGGVGCVGSDRRATTGKTSRSKNDELLTLTASARHVRFPLESRAILSSSGGQSRRSAIRRRAASTTRATRLASAALLLACCCYSATIADAFALSSPRASVPPPPWGSRSFSASAPSSSAHTSSTSLGVRKNRADFTTDGASYDKIARNSVDVLTAVGNTRRTTVAPNGSKTRLGRKQHKQQQKQQQQQQQQRASVATTSSSSATSSSVVTTTAVAAATAATAPNPLLDSFRPKYEILMPQDATLMGRSRSGSGSLTATTTTKAPLVENEEAKDRKSIVDQRIADLLEDDSGEEDEGDDDSDRDNEAANDGASDDDAAAGANDIADRRSYSQMSDYAKARATQAMSKSTVGAASASFSPRKVVSKKKRVTASVQETGRDTINSYTKSFTNHELLSREAEATLGREIQLLVRWEVERQELEVRLLRAPTFGEWAKAVDVSVADLKKQIRKSQRAKAALIEANLRLVVTSARSLVKKSRSEINFHDACQDGIIGLTRACEKFNPDKDFRFSTYALWWIKGEIMKSVNSQASTIRLPTSARKKINEIRINERILMAEKGRKPTDEEIAKKSNLTLKQLRFYRRSAQDVVSIDQNLQAQRGRGSAASGDSAKGVTQIGDLVKDEGPSPEELASKQMLKEDVRRLVKSLSPREQVVIRMRFGLDDGEPKTLDAIAKRFRVATNQIKKLETRALAKLRQRGPDSSLLD